MIDGQFNNRITLSNDHKPLEGAELGIFENESNLL